MEESPMKGSAIMSTNRNGRFRENALPVVETLDELSEAEIEELWVEEAERRLDELEQGMAAEIPADEVLARVRAAIS